jgi:hypothetical protein
LNAHGNPNGVQLPSGFTSDPKAIADYIRAQPGYTPGMPVKLAACSTGSGTNNIAQRLSNEMGVPVTAPQNTLWVWQNGTSAVSSAQPTTASSGGWNTFNPTK